MLRYKQFIQEKYILPAVKLHLRALDKVVTGPEAVKKQRPLTGLEKTKIHASRIAALATGTAISGATTAYAMGGKPGVVAGSALVGLGSMLGPHITDTIKYRNKLKQQNSLKEGEVIPFPKKNNTTDDLGIKLISTGISPDRQHYTMYNSNNGIYHHYIRHSSGKIYGLPMGKISLQQAKSLHDDIVNDHNNRK